jgi:hypothetical protein
VHEDAADKQQRETEQQLTPVDYGLPEHVAEVRCLILTRFPSSMEPSCEASAVRPSRDVLERTLSTAVGLAHVLSTETR